MVSAGVWPAPHLVDRIELLMADHAGSWKIFGSSAHTRAASAAAAAAAAASSGVEWRPAGEGGASPHTASRTQAPTPSCAAAAAARAQACRRPAAVWLFQWLFQWWLLRGGYCVRVREAG